MDASSLKPHQQICHCTLCGKLVVKLKKDLRIYPIPYCSRSCSAKANAKKASAACRVPIEESFDKFVIRRGPTDCWGWSGRSKTGRGYAQLHRNGRTMYAHRVSYEMEYGPIPKGAVVRHACDNPVCTNPAHLCVGSNADNARDMVVRGRSARGERNGQAKLNVLQVRAIMSLCLGGYSQQEVAALFGVEPSTISGIMVGKSWIHLRSRQRPAPPPPKHLLVGAA